VAVQKKIYHYSDGIRYKCSECSRVFRIITGTIFGDTRIKKLSQWFLAIYFETTQSEGIGNSQLAKHLDIRQPTAWFMLQRIRNALTQMTSENLNAVCFRENSKHDRKEKMDIVNAMFSLGLETRITYRELIR